MSGRLYADRLQVTDERLADFCRRWKITELALFGSVLREDFRPDSDVDLLVEFAPGEKSFDRFMALSDLLERLLGHHVELVTVEALSPFIGPHILAEAADVLRAA